MGFTCYLLYTLGQKKKCVFRVIWNFDMGMVGREIFLFVKSFCMGLMGKQYGRTGKSSQNP